MSTSPPSSKPTRRERPAGGPFRLILLYTRGLIVDQHLRRVTMFYTVLAAMLMAFVGYAFLMDWMHPPEHFYRFAVYWLLCGWLTMLSGLLAIYDILMVRIQAQLVRRALREKMLIEAARQAERDK